MYFNLGGHDYPVFITSGTIIADKKYSTTKVSGSGCQGYVNISSNTSTVTDFWIKNDEGEINFKFPVDMPMRSGQRVAIVHTKNKRDNIYIAVMNFNADMIYYLQDPLELVKSITGKNANIGCIFLLTLSLLAIVLSPTLSELLNIGMGKTFLAMLAAAFVTSTLLTRPFHNKLERIKVDLIRQMKELHRKLYPKEKIDNSNN